MKQKRVGTKIRREANGIEVLETKLVDRPDPCKECGKNPRARASARCTQCRLAFKQQQLRHARLNEKITNQINTDKV